MDEKKLTGIITKAVLQGVVEVVVIDVFADQVTSYQTTSGMLSLGAKESLESYVESVKTRVQPQYLSGYMSAISIPKLEEASRGGTDKLEFKYQKMNGKWYKLISFLINGEGKKSVVLITVALNDKNGSGTIENNTRYNSLIENVSDSILKIYNVFSVDSERITDVKKIEEYVNAVLSQLASNYPELKKSLNKTAANVSGMTYDTILIVDDDMVTRNMIKKVFDNEYKIVTSANGKEAIDYLEANGNKGVIESTDNILGIFLDLTMPVMDGFEVLEYLSRNNYLSKIPVIIISGDYEKETKARVYNYNIADMLEKPFDFQVVKHRISNFINLYKSSNSLGELISDQNMELKGLINPFVEAYEYDYRDNINNVNNYVQVLAEQFMKDYPESGLDDEKIRKMADASRYYDIGFYSIPRSVLSKRGNFSNEELKRIKQYPLFGAEMIKYVLSLVSDMKYKEFATNITKYYHENFDGTGYPEGLKGEQIPLEAQIVSLAIMYNSLKKKGKQNIDEVIVNKSGRVFNPKLVSSFTKVAQAFKDIK